MSDSDKSFDAVRKAIADHAAASEFVRNLDETVAIWNEKDPVVKINGMRAFLKTHVEEHFAMEDEEVFPHLLVVHPDESVSNRVARLQQDHERLTAEVTRLHGLLAQVERSADPQVMAELELLFRMFLGQLQRHAAEEDKLFALLAARYVTQPSS